MAQWIATIGALDKVFEFDARTSEEAILTASKWLSDLCGKDVPLCWEADTLEPELYTNVVLCPFIDSTIRPWPFRLFKRFAIKRHVELLAGVVTLSMVKDYYSAWPKKIAAQGCPGL